MFLFDTKGNYPQAGDLFSQALAELMNLKPSLSKLAAVLQKIN